MSRPWFKVWTNEWLDGTTRFQMTGAQRAFWMDLIAQAARSRYPGVICSGKDGDGFVGYPLTTFCALDPGGELDILATFELFAGTGKIVLEVTSEKPVKLYKVTIINWGKYQSEYLRQKSYRQKNKQVTPKVTTKVTTGHTKRLPVEVEIEVEGEVDKTICSASSAEPSVSLPPVIQLPLIDGSEHYVSQAEVDEWMRLYPAVDVMQELRNIRGWLLANPKRRKTRSGVGKCINGWLAKEQDKGPRTLVSNSADRSAKQVPGAMPKRHSDLNDADRAVYNRHGVSA
jgi:hypothetical protein